MGKAGKIGIQEESYKEGRKSIRLFSAIKNAGAHCPVQQLIEKS